MREALNILNTQIQVEKQKLVDYFLRHTDYSSDLFTMHGSFSANLSIDQIIEKTAKLRGRRGVYFFVANQDFEISNQQVFAWNNEENDAPITTTDQNSNPCGTNVSTGDIFYLGSSAAKKRSLLVRLREHCNHAENKSSLKLRNAHRDWVRQYLDVFYFATDKSYSIDENRIILPSLERYLHSSLSPIVGGKQT